MTRIQTWFTWLDDHAVLLLAGFLLAFIPLYPKLPLFEIIEGYLVRARLEDVFVLLAMILWFIQVARKKITFRTPLTIPILAYAVVGFLSTLSAIVITSTIPAESIHIAKSTLHYFRYIEYFSLFFILATTVKRSYHIKIILGVIIVTLIGVTVYGIGQRYWYWPVYSTMNREFAKGVRLILTEHARVQSTFGGHYDLAGYLVLVLPLLIAIRHYIASRWLKLLLFIIYIGGMWLMVVSASRTSFAGYLLGGWIVIALLAWQKSSLPARIGSLVAGSLVFLLLNTIMMLRFGDSMYDRLVQVIDGYPVISQPYHQSVKTISEQSAAARDFVFSEAQQRFFRRNMMAQKPDNAIEVDEVIIPSDTQPSPARPSDVYDDVPVIVPVATTSADGQIIITEEERPRTYSDNALKYGLSLAIRLDTLWPRAIQGFYSNPLLGSGYATLTRESRIHFTEAESTDNNFLRTLGETGALGFITFYGTVAISMWIAFKINQKKNAETLHRAIATGYIGGTVGLLINAIFIDVFAASKVAFYFWGLTGLLVAAALLEFPDWRKKSWTWVPTWVVLPKKLQALLRS